MLKLLFLGTPRFAVPTLDAIVHAGYEVAGVFTQPGRPKGRGQKPAESPVKDAAAKHGIPVFQPERIKRPEIVAQLAGFHADAMVVVGYGQIISQAIIDLPRLGIINVHASLLPKFRGAAPIQWAIARGETRTGVTTMRINAGLDTGDMLLRWETEIGLEENAIELGNRMSVAGAELLVTTLRGLENGTITPEPQDDAQSSLAPILKKDDGRIDWAMGASEIHNRVRGFLPWPGSYTTFRGQRLHIWKARIAENAARDFGILGMKGRHLIAACGHETALEIEEVQLEGRKKMPAEAFLNGYPLLENERLGEN